MKRTHWMTAAFFCCILGPNLLFPFFRTDADLKTAENRTLASFPKFSMDTLDSFPASVENWINDHAAFRNRFLTLNATLNLQLFGHADSSDVITGKDGWYFYSAGNSVEDFLGLNRFSETELTQLGQQIQAVSDYWAGQGTQLIFLAAPNKEGVYSEYLPDGFKAPEGPTRRQELLDWLREHTTVSIADPYPFLKENRDYQWYFKTDTHWNDAAGFAVSQLLIETAGGTPAPITDVTIEYVPREAGDLANQFHLPDALAQETAAVVHRRGGQPEVQFEDAAGDGNIVHITTPSSPDSRRITIYRDSFGAALLAGLPDYFRHTDFYHWQAFDFQFLKDNPPDILVYEVVERDLGRMAEDLAKLMPPSDVESGSDC